MHRQVRPRAFLCWLLLPGQFIYLVFCIRLIHPLPSTGVGEQKTKMASSMSLLLVEPMRFHDLVQCLKVLVDHSLRQKIFAAVTFCGYEAEGYFYKTIVWSSRVSQPHLDGGFSEVIRISLHNRFRWTVLFAFVVIGYFVPANAICGFVSCAFLTRSGFVFVS